ncbi:hypothetical protein [Allosalinactinospora lopnorensis]|nr:hypothetical protein [Allosalinactinospora lopnorensis]
MSPGFAGDDLPAQPGGLTLLHADKDFEVVAGITGQPLERSRLA